MTALHGEFTPKFLATRDVSGGPNVVPIISLDAADDRTLVFGELFIWKTRSNLETDPRVGIAVVTEDLRVWTIRGRFREFVTSGPHLEAMNEKDLFRYNAYVRVSRVAVIDVEAVTASARLSKAGIAADLVRTRLIARLGGSESATAQTLPARVADKFARSQAVKVIAWTGEDGHPDVAPVFSLTPTQTDDVLFARPRGWAALDALPAETRVAASVITMDPIAYQIKGTYIGQRRTTAGRIGRVRVDEVYSASPPLAGDRIEM